MTRSRLFSRMIKAGSILSCAAVLCVSGLRPSFAAKGSSTRHLLYVAVPGIRNYLEYGGIGVLVFDMDHGYKFVKRIPTWTISPGQKPENVKGVVASATTGRLYVSTQNRMAAFDLATDKKLWDNAFEGGCDRMAISPDGKTIYVPSFEGPFWTVVDGMSGTVLGKVVTNSGSHNTIYADDGSKVYLAGLHLNYLLVVNPQTRSVNQRVGPFSNVVRPFTVNGSNTRCYVNVNDLLGFEIGDVTTGKELCKVQVQGFEKGPTKRHGCPSHGIALSPDEKELWLADGANNYVHVFDNTVMPPKQIESIKTRDMPGWITLSIDGRHVIPSTGDIIDRATRKIVNTLQDESGQQVQSEKLLEIDFEGNRPVRAGNQFGVGEKR